MNGTSTASTSPTKIKPRKIGTIGKPLPEEAEAERPITGVGAGVGVGVGAGVGGNGLAVGAAGGEPAGTAVVKTLEVI